MLFKVVSVAVLAAVLGAFSADAQSLKGISGPAELPPAGYKGQSYVDSRGCVFLRAGYGGTVNWVPRVTRDRKPLCGYPRTQFASAVPVTASAPVRQAAATAAPAPTVIAAAPSPKPGPTVIAAPAARAPQVAQAAPRPSIAGAVMAPPSPAPAPTVIAGQAAAPIPAARVAAPVVAHTSDSTAVYAQLQAQERAATPRALVQPWATSAAPAGQAMACDPSVPLAKRFRTSDGRSVILCTRADGSVEGAQAPIIASASGFAAWQLQAQVEAGQGQRARTYYKGGGASVVVAPSTRAAAAAPVSRLPGVDRAPIATATGYNAWMLGTKGGSVSFTDPAAVPGVVHVPKGYKPAWRDGRLNPMRGLGTMDGQVQQDMVWTREVPARLVPRSAAPQQVIVLSSKSAGKPETAPRSTVTVSSKSAPQAPAKATKGGIYVQVGTFGQAGNADAAKARLRAAGLPIGTAKITKGGQAMQIVFTGPYADAGSAQRALKAARGAGFGDAFIR